MRILLCGLLGGVVMFFWGFVSHMLLPLGDAGLQVLPYQDEVLPQLATHLPQDGLYVFPWPESPPGTPMPQNEEAMKKAEEMYKTMPSGLIIFHPPGRAMLSPRQLITEFATNVVTSLIAAFLVSMVVNSLDQFAKRMMFVTVIGLIAGIAVNIPHWNWYGFPMAFTLAEIIGHVVGFLLMGAVVAALIRPTTAVGAKAAVA